MAVVTPSRPIEARSVPSGSPLTEDHPQLTINDGGRSVAHSKIPTGYLQDNVEVLPSIIIPSYNPFRDL